MHEIINRYFDDRREIIQSLEYFVSIPGPVIRQWRIERGERNIGAPTKIW